VSRHSTSRISNCNIAHSLPHLSQNKCHSFYITYLDLLTDKKTIIIDDITAALAYINDQLEALQQINIQEGQILENGE